MISARKFSSKGTFLGLYFEARLYLKALANLHDYKRSLLAAT